MIVGSQEWCNYWANFHWERAIKFSRLKYPLDEQCMYEALFMMHKWEDTEPWA